MIDEKWRDDVEGFGLDTTVEDLSKQMGRVEHTSSSPTASNFTFQEQLKN